MFHDIQCPSWLSYIPAKLSDTSHNPDTMTEDRECWQNIDQTRAQQGDTAECTTGGPSGHDVIVGP